MWVPHPCCHKARLCSLGHDPIHDPRPGSPALLGSWGDSVKAGMGTVRGEPLASGHRDGYCSAVSNVTGALRRKQAGVSEAPLSQPCLTLSPLRGPRTMGPWR